MQLGPETMAIDQGRRLLNEKLGRIRELRMQAARDDLAEDQRRLGEW